MRKVIILLSSLAAAACGEVSADSPDAGPGPSLTAIEPNHGPLGGGATVTATGTRLSSEGAIVLVGGILATDVAVVDDQTLTFTAPAGLQAGSTVDVTVSTQTGFTTLPDAFTYGTAPVVLSFEPSFVAQDGGTTVTITGRGFADLDAGTTVLTVAGVAVASIEVVDDETITATTAEASSAVPFERADVELSNANGTVTLEGEVQVTAQGLIAIERNCCTGQRKMLFIQPSTGLVSQIGSSTQAIRGCATSADGTLFTASSGGFVLATLDPLTGNVNALGQLRDIGNADKRRSTRRPAW
jgi:hypothetical protein